MSTFTSPWDDDPLMAPAFWGCVSWAAGNPEVVARFEADTGQRIGVLARSPIERMIDNAAGYDPKKELGQAFIDWVAGTIFGTPEDLAEGNEDV